MTKTPKVRTLIEANKKLITQMLSGSGTVKRLNNVNWLRHELSYTEPRALFHIPAREQSPYLDYNCMKNIGEAYDYIVDNIDTPIDANEICRLHSILCAGTHIHGGVFRSTNKILDITVNGARYRAPDARDIAAELNDIVYKLSNSRDDPLIGAIKVHYDMVMLQTFDDFNKRTSRLVMNWALIQGGYRPIIFNRPSDKVKYREAIAACANGNTRAYTTYMYDAMLHTQQDIIKLLNTAKVL